MLRINRRNGCALSLAGVVGILASGCLAQIEDEGEADSTLDEADSALDLLNAISPNAISPNAVSPNAISPNAISPNAISPNAMAPNVMAALQSPTPEGELSRQLLRYTVGCALSTSQSFSFSWTDGHGKVKNETYWGILGLATSWATKPLTGSAQEWVSACLAARVNWYGTSVMISSRGGTPSLNKSAAPELATYTMNEGAFWGNLFSSTPYLYACHYGPNTAYSRSKMRDCAAGHVLADGTIAECGIIEIVGACEDVCASLTPQGKFYPSCTGPDGVASTAVVTTFLM